MGAEDCEDMAKTINSYLAYHRMEQRLSPGMDTGQDIQNIMKVAIRLFEKREADLKKREEMEQRTHRLYDDEKELQKTIARLKKKGDDNKAELKKQTHTACMLRDKLERAERKLTEAGEEKERSLQSRAQLEKHFEVELRRRDGEIVRLQDQLQSAHKTGAVEIKGMSVRWHGGLTELAEEESGLIMLLRESEEKTRVFSDENKAMKEVIDEDRRWLCRMWRTVSDEEEGIAECVRELEETDVAVVARTDKIKELCEIARNSIEENILEIERLSTAQGKELEEAEKKQEREIKRLTETVEYEQKLKQNCEIIISVLREEISSIKKSFYSGKQKEETAEQQEDTENKHQENKRKLAKTVLNARTGEKDSPRRVETKN
ncbi:MAG: uncharacterized protein A8A55_0851 [Amphiamblys sp. WSBS2006]|nr:MAG: uncharacterized protein A8A55_0851 [Amphiamblys sp. WSBS2006]